jgi:hypothetical protein
MGDPAAGPVISGPGEPVISGTDLRLMNGFRYGPSVNEWFPVRTFG